MCRSENFWRFAAAAGALTVGIWLGQFLRNRESVRISPQTELSSDSRSFTDGEDSVESARSPRPRRQVDAGITFSRTQWSKLMRNPDLGYVAITDCLDATNQLETQIPVVDGIPLIGRLFDGRISRMPDLQNQAEFFGWDDGQTKQVRRALVDFGDHLAEAEKSAGVVDYPDDQMMRIDFSASQDARMRIVGKLRDDLAAILGERDAERFAVLSRMDGLARELPSVYEIKPPVLDVIIFSDPNAPGEDQTVYDLSSMGGKSWHEGLDRRVRHLEINIDWDRILPKPNPIGK